MKIVLHLPCGDAELIRVTHTYDALSVDVLEATCPCGQYGGSVLLEEMTGNLDEKLQHLERSFVKAHAA